MESMSIANKILEDTTRFYVVVDKNAMEYISIANNSLKILRDTRQKCYGIHINSKQHTKGSYKILGDTKQKCNGIHINSKQDPIRFYGILEKNAMEPTSPANKILQDSTGY